MPKNQVTLFTQDNRYCLYNLICLNVDRNWVYKEIIMTLKK